MPSRNELVIRGNAVGLTASSYPNDSKFEAKILYMEKNGTTYTETLGTQTLTQSGPATTGDKITVGNRTYTFVTALSGVKATQTLTGTDVFSDGETVTIRGVTYTFKTALTSANQAYQVLIGASLAVSLDNLKIAINASGGTEGTEYGSGTKAHPYVSATTNNNTQQVVQALNFGTAQNSWSVSETCANASWGASTLAGGTENVLDELKLTGVAETELNLLKDAINNTELLDGNLEGTNYSFGTRAHTQVTATTNGATTQVVQSRNAAFDNASIATTDPVDGGTVFSWGGTTLSSGVRGVTAVNTTTTGGGPGVSGDSNHV